MERSRVRWACRRGMLELDLFLLPFFDNQFDIISPEEQQYFIKLLENSDQDLFNWFMNKEKISNQNFTKIIDIIRKYHFENSKA